MRVATLDTITVSFPYRHRELSSQVARDGVTDVVVRIETDDGCVGWGEACCGADAASVEAAIHAMAPFVIGSDPWNREAVQHELYLHGLWQFRAGTANFAWAGIDMALADLAARSAGVPLYKLFGGLRRMAASYFFYLARGTATSWRRSAPPASRRASTRSISRSESSRRRILRWSRRCARPSAPALGSGSTRTGRGRSRRRARCSTRCPSTRSTSSSSRSGTTRSLTSPSCASRAGRGLRERGALERGGRLRAHRRPAGGRVLLQPVLGRLARRVPSALARRAPRGPAGLQAHPRRARTSPRLPAITSCSRCRTSSRGTSRRRT